MGTYGYFSIHTNDFEVWGFEESRTREWKMNLVVTESP
jgi:hypothetical protein